MSVTCTIHTSVLEQRKPPSVFSTHGLSLSVSTSVAISQKATFLKIYLQKKSVQQSTRWLLFATASPRGQLPHKLRTIECFFQHRRLNPTWVTFTTPHPWESSAPRSRKALKNKGVKARKQLKTHFHVKSSTTHPSYYTDLVTTNGIFTCDDTRSRRHEFTYLTLSDTFNHFTGFAY